MKYADIIQMPRPQAPALCPSTVDVPPTVDPSLPQPSTVDVPTTVDRQTRFEARRAQDAHTVWEQALYQAMWTAGGKGDDSRILTAGYRTLSKASRLSDKAVKRNLEALEKKLAIEEIAPEDIYNRTGRTYRVYGYRAILERRKAAGLVWVVRKGHAILLSSVDGHTTVDVPSTVDEAPIGTVDVPSPSTVDEPTTPLGSNRKVEEGPCPRCNGTGWITWQGKRRKCGCR